MTISRRTFFGLVAGIMAMPAIIARAISRPPGVLASYWFQTTRTTYCTSLPYDDAIDEAMSPKDDPGLRFRWHERRKRRSRERLAESRRQRPLPLP